MKLENENMTTPVYLKTDKNMEWPKDKMFYILSSDGLFLCRNHEWFQSCAPAKHGPGELEPQESFATINYPIVPRHLIEKAVGFFRRIEKDHYWESAVILVWNRQTEKMELICPEQKASGASVKYDIPKLPQHLMLIGDIHSHCNFSPTPSMTDEGDEMHRPGLHIVAGYIMSSKVEFHVVAVVDGERFTIENHDEVMEKYQDSDLNSVPQEWIDKVKPLYAGGSKYSYAGDYDGGNYQYTGNPMKEPDKTDKKILAPIIKKWSESDKKPEVYEIRQEMFTKTHVTSYLWCERKAEEIVENWIKKYGKTTTKQDTAPTTAQELLD